MKKIMRAYRITPETDAEIKRQAAFSNISEADVIARAFAAFVPIKPEQSQSSIARKPILKPSATKL